MGFYARHPGRLARQITADVFMIVWVVLWWLAGRAVEDAGTRLADPAQRISDASRRLAEQVHEAADQAGRLPGVGGQLRAPLDNSTLSLTNVADSAQQLVHTILQFGVLLGWAVFLIPVLTLLAIWLPIRIRFYRQARAAQVFLAGPADLELFALRAMSTEPLSVLTQISNDPVGAWRRGDAEVIRRLATAELRRCGLRPPGGPPRLDA